MVRRYSYAAPRRRYIMGRQRGRARMSPYSAARRRQAATRLQWWYRMMLARRRANRRRYLPSSYFPLRGRY